jgi:hypothetical protein
MIGDLREEICMNATFMDRRIDSFIVQEMGDLESRISWNVAATRSSHQVAIRPQSYTPSPGSIQLILLFAAENAGSRAV